LYSANEPSSSRDMWNNRNSPPYEGGVSAALG
jgi:hypothetical protein